ncbi:MAG: ABC transporter permease [Bowdeniella nasicola]|nr:ABC transporter permease [Bowdeniella nasicola]
MTHLLQAIRINAWSDIRPNFIGAGLFALLFTPVVLVGVGWWIKGSAGGGDAYGTLFSNVFLAGAAGALPGFVTLQLTGEFYQERLNGGLLRARTLPHGPIVWTVSKTVSSLVVTLIIQIITVGAGMIAFFSLSVTPGALAAAVLIAVVATFAAAPLGFIAGVFIRGAFTQIIASLVLLGLMATSGGFFPLSFMPRWLQIIQQVLPFYWSTHLSRYALLGSGNATAELGGSYHPALAVLILGAWIVVGFALASLAVRFGFRRETISTVARMQQTFKKQAGI